VYQISFKNFKRLLRKWQKNFREYFFCRTLYSLVRAARCDNATHEPLCFAAVSFFLFFIQREISAVSPAIAAKLCHMIGNGAILKTRSKIWGPPPKNMGPKACFWRDFGRIRTLIANISGTEQDIDNRKTALQTISPASADVIWSTNGEK